MRKKSLAMVVIAIISIWVLNAVIIVLLVDKDFRGVAGDMFGAVNALFAGLAFAGIIYTIAIQRQELQEQQKAIRMQTEELSLQRKAIEMQNDELRMQREETARSADQLESQRQLMNLQIAMNTVYESIKAKNKKIEAILHRKMDGNPSMMVEVMGIEAIRQICLDHLDGKQLIRGDNPALQGLLNTFFFTLQYIIDSDLATSQKLILARLVNIDTTDVELYLICHASIENEHNRGLLDDLRFIERFKKLDAEWSKRNINLLRL